MARVHEAEEHERQNAEDEAMRKKEMRRQCRSQLNLPDYDSFDEDFDFELPTANESERETRKSQVRSLLGVPDYDSFDEDF